MQPQIERWLENPIFAAAGAEGTSDLARVVRYREHPAGTAIGRVGQPAEQVHVLLQGRMEVLHDCADGRQTLSRILCSPNLCGDVEVLNEAPWMATVVTMDDCLVAEVDGTEYVSWLERHPGALMEHLRQLGAAHCLSLLNEGQWLHRLEQRVANLVLTYAEMDGRVEESPVIDRALTQQHLARRLGVTRRAVGHVLEQWLKQKLVARRGQSLVVLRPEVLEGLAAPMRRGLLHHMGLRPAGPVAVSADFAELLVVGGPGRQDQRHVVQDELTIGRRPSAGLMMRDEKVSGLHCRIFLAASGGRYWVEDFDSLNGTWLNGAKVRRAVLRHGDRLVVGHSELEFCLRSDEVSGAGEQLSHVSQNAHVVRDMRTGAAAVNDETPVRAAAVAGG